MQLRSNPYLVRLKGFLNLLEAREQANVGADLVHCGAQAGEDVDEFAVQFAGVRLTGDRPDTRKSRLLRHQLVQLGYLKGMKLKNRINIGSNKAVPATQP